MEVQEVELSEELRDLYLQSGKHAGYQSLPQELLDALDLKEENLPSKYEKERMSFICDNIRLEEKDILDIGGNTGYFTFESIKRGCKSVVYYEGNKVHAEFVEKAKHLFDGERIEVHPEYYLFQEKQKKYDVVFCLNVIHHLGDDFFEIGNMEQAKEKMLTCINHLSYITDYMVFQMGFNWCGDRNRCLFNNGIKQEMEQFLMSGTETYWEIVNIGIAEKKSGNMIIYNKRNENNNVRIDELGEFLNRPLFIMKSQR